MVRPCVMRSGGMDVHEYTYTPYIHPSMAPSTRRNTIRNTITNALKSISFSSTHSGSATRYMQVCRCLHECLWLCVCVFLHSGTLTFTKCSSMLLQMLLLWGVGHLVTECKWHLFGWKCFGGGRGGWKGAGIGDKQQDSETPDIEYTSCFLHSCVRASVCWCTRNKGDGKLNSSHTLSIYDVPSFRFRRLSCETTPTLNHTHTHTHSHTHAWQIYTQDICLFV